MAVQGSKHKCFSDQGRSHIAFFVPDAEAKYGNVSHTLLGEVLISNPESKGRDIGLIL